MGNLFPSFREQVVCFVPVALPHNTALFLSRPAARAFSAKHPNDFSLPPDSSHQPAAGPPPCAGTSCASPLSHGVQQPLPRVVEAHGRRVEVRRIVDAADLGEHLVVLLVVRIGDHSQKLGDTGRTAAVLGRALPLAGQAAWIAHPGLGQGNGLEQHRVQPRVPVVVFVAHANTGKCTVSLEFASPPGRYPQFIVRVGDADLYITPQLIAHVFG